MLSQTLYDLMKIDTEFNSKLEKASLVEAEYAVNFANASTQDIGPLNRSYHEMHRSAFELSLLFSPRATKTPSLFGDYLLTLMSIVKMGQNYVFNLKNLIKNSNLKQSQVKRVDKIELNLAQIESLLNSLEEELQSSLSLYVENNTPPSKKDISRYNKTLLKIRRTYYRMQSKIHKLEEHFDFSKNSYRTYEPLMRLMRSRFVESHTGISSRALRYKEYISSILKDSGRYATVVYDVEKRPTLNRKNQLDLEDTLFIMNYNLPREVVAKHVQLLRAIPPAILSSQDDYIKMKPLKMGLAGQ